MSIPLLLWEQIEWNEEQALKESKMLNPDIFLKKFHNMPSF
jgi:hypothetical protein